MHNHTAVFQSKQKYGVFSPGFYKVLVTTIHGGTKKRPLNLTVNTSWHQCCQQGSQRSELLISTGNAKIIAPSSCIKQYGLVITFCINDDVIKHELQSKY